MNKLTMQKIKGNFEILDHFYGENCVKAVIEDGRKTSEIVLGNRAANYEALEHLIKDCIDSKNIEAVLERVKFSESSRLIDRLLGRDNSKIANEIFGTTVNDAGTINVNSKPKYRFYSIERFDGSFPGPMYTELKELKC